MAKNLKGSSYDPSCFIISTWNTCANNAFEYSNLDQDCIAIANSLTKMANSLCSTTASIQAASNCINAIQNCAYNPTSECTGEVFLTGACQAYNTSCGINL